MCCTAHEEGKYINIMCYIAHDRALLIAVMCRYQLCGNSRKVVEELCRGIGAVFLESFHKAPAGILVNGSILIEFLSFGIVDQDKASVHKALGHTWNWEVSRLKGSVYTRSGTSLLFLGSTVTHVL